MPQFSFRPATKSDIPLILSFIRELAAHEGRPEAATATEERLDDLLFSNDPVAYGFIGSSDGEPVAYCLLARKFSSFRATRTLYIEDVLVSHSARGGGIGRKMMVAIAKIALTWRCNALEWSAIADNSEAIGFYDNLGATRETGHLHFSLNEARLNALADENTS